MRAQLLCTSTIDGFFSVIASWLLSYYMQRMLPFLAPAWHGVLIVYGSHLQFHVHACLHHFQYVSSLLVKAGLLGQIW